MPDVGWRPQEHMELVTFAASPAIPHELAAPLLKRGVPKEMLGLYRAASKLTLLEDSGGGQYVCFGSIGYAQRACLDPETGAVVVLMDTLRGDNEVVGIVNSSLEQFIASVNAVINLYPFDSPQATGESDERYLDRSRAELGQAADDLKRALQIIDPVAAADHGRFWLDFIDDVQMGTYSTGEDA